MSKVTGVMLSGKIGNVVYYKKNGICLARAMPARVRQSENTKIRSINFGVAARAGKVLRNGLLPAIPFPADKNMQSRFSGSICKWLGLQSVQSLPPAQDVPYVADFMIHDKAAFRERFRVVYTINNLHPDSLELTLPAFVPTHSIVAPANTISVKCIIAIAGCELATSNSTGAHSVILDIPYDAIEIPELKIIWPFTETSGNLIVAAGSLVYTVLTNGNKKESGLPGFMPSTVIKAMYC